VGYAKNGKTNTRNWNISNILLFSLLTTAFFDTCCSTKEITLQLILMFLQECRKSTQIDRVSLLV